MNNLELIEHHFRPEMRGQSGYLPHYQEFDFMHKVWHENDLPDDMNDRVASDKWDGYTVSLLYVDGALIKALGQGDGVFGPDVTDTLKSVVQNDLQDAAALYPIESDGIVQIVGEVVADTHDPADAYQGVCEGKDVGLEFIAFDVSPSVFTLWTHAMTYLQKIGFKTVWTHHDDEHSKDGIVHRINNEKVYRASEKGLVALKFYD